MSSHCMPGLGSSYPSDFADAVDQLLFTANDGMHGREFFSYRPDAPLTADINGDNEVSFADFLLLSSNFGQQTDQGPQAGDLDLDGTVSFADFLLLRAEFGRRAVV